MKKTLKQRLGIILHDHGDDWREDIYSFDNLLKRLEPKLRQLLADAQIEALEEFGDCDDVPNWDGYFKVESDKIRKRWGIET